MRDALCRLTVRLHDGAAVDLGLPADMSVGQLMPSIVDIVGQSHAVPDCRLRLSRVGGAALDESMSLTENAVHDGEVLVLAADAPASPKCVDLDPSHYVARSASTDGERAVRVMRAICGVFMAAVGAAALVRSATPSTVVGHVSVGAVAATAGFAGAVLAGRFHAGAWVCVPVGLVAVIFAAATGFLAVPTGSPAAHALLACAAAFSVSTILDRLMACGTVFLDAVTTAGALTSAVASICIIWRLGPDAAGALLATLSVATLAVAPRIAIWLTGIAPAMPSVDDADESAAEADVPAMVAHRTLSGIVIGASACASSGAALAGYGCLQTGGSRLGAAVLAAVIALVLALRARTYAGGGRRAALAAGGIASAAACFAIGAISLPMHAHWMSLGAAAAAMAVACPTSGLAASPAAHRIADLADYAALAAVVPAACWVGGLFGLVREMSVI